MFIANVRLLNNVGYVGWAWKIKSLAVHHMFLTGSGASRLCGVGSPDFFKKPECIFSASCGESSHEAAAARLSRKVSPDYLYAWQ